MEDEYQFNYDEIKQIFESVPATISKTNWSKTISYKTHFQPRRKSLTTIENETCLNTSAMMVDKTDQLPKTISIKLQCFYGYPLMPIEQFSLQTEQGFYLIPCIQK